MARDARGTYSLAFDLAKVPVRERVPSNLGPRLFAVSAFEGLAEPDVVRVGPTSAARRERPGERWVAVALCCAVAGHIAVRRQPASLLLSLGVRCKSPSRPDPSPSPRPGAEYKRSVATERLGRAAIWHNSLGSSWASRR